MNRIEYIKIFIKHIPSDIMQQYAYQYSLSACPPLHQLLSSLRLVYHNITNIDLSKSFDNTLSLTQSIHRKLCLILHILTSYHSIISEQIK